MMRRKERATTGSFDSLLDTMSNVIGILIMTLAVSQLNVEKAIRRIRYHGEEIPNVNSYQLRDAESNLESTEAKLKYLSTRYKNMTDEGLLDPVRLDKNRKIIELLQHKQTLVKNNINLTDQLDEPGAIAKKQQLQSLREVISRKRMWQQKLQLEVQQSKSEYHALKQEEQERIATIRANTKTLRLPDPRDPPGGSTPLFFFCQYEKLFVLDKTALLSSSAFRVVPLRKGGIKITIQDRSKGESISQINESYSNFRLALNRYSPSDKFVFFYVWNDSFASYIKARAIAESKGYAVGWMVFKEGESLVKGTANGRSARID
jgi:hypothetical protein